MTVVVSALPDTAAATAPGSAAAVTYPVSADATSESSAYCGYGLLDGGPPPPGSTGTVGVAE